MNILFLCKRHYMRHDVIVDKYARLYEIPYQLSRLNCDVTALSLSYRRSEKGHLTHKKNFNWFSFNIPSYFFGLWKIVKQKQIDTVFAGSDVLHIVIGFCVAKVLKKPFCADLYDNYESFGLASIPGLKRLYRYALCHADKIYVVSDALGDYVKKQVGHNRVITLESCIDKNVFCQMDTNTALEALQLTKDAGQILIGLCGAIDKSRGAQYVFDAVTKAQTVCKNKIVLVLAGDLEPNLELPSETMFLGRLQHSEMNAFFNAMDINVISMIPNDFGKFAFPQKAYEMAAAEKPCLVPNFGPMAKLFIDTPNALYKPCDAQSIANAIFLQIENPQPPRFSIPTWKEQARVVKLSFDGLLANNPH